MEFPLTRIERTLPSAVGAAEGRKEREGGEGLHMRMEVRLDSARAAERMLAAGREGKHGTDK